MEKRISSKINYDVLKDLADGFGSSASEINNLTNSSSQPVPQEDDVKDGVLPPITRTPLVARGRLPSLSARKRTFSTLEASPTMEPKYGTFLCVISLLKLPIFGAII